MGVFVDKPCWGTEELIGKRVVAVPVKGFNFHTKDASISPDKYRVIGVLQRQVHFTCTEPRRASAVIVTDYDQQIAVHGPELIEDWAAEMSMFYISTYKGLAYVRFTDVQGYMTDVEIYSKSESPLYYQNAYTLCRDLNRAADEGMHQLQLLLDESVTPDTNLMAEIRQRWITRHPLPTSNPFAYGPGQAAVESHRLDTKPDAKDEDERVPERRPSLTMLWRNLRTLMRRPV